MMKDTLYSYLPCGFMVYLGLYVHMCVIVYVAQGEINRIVIQMMNSFHSSADYAMKIQRRQHRRPPECAGVYQITVSCISVVLRDGHGAL